MEALSRHLPFLGIFGVLPLSLPQLEKKALTPLSLLNLSFLHSTELPGGSPLSGPPLTHPCPTAPSGCSQIVRPLYFPLFLLHSPGRPAEQIVLEDGAPTSSPETQGAIPADGGQGRGNEQPLNYF